MSPSAGRTPTSSSPSRRRSMRSQLRPRFEPRGEPRRDVRGKHGCGKEDGVCARVLDHRLERVHPGLRERRGEGVVVDDVYGRRAEPACRCGCVPRRRSRARRLRRRLRATRPCRGRRGRPWSARRRGSRGRPASACAQTSRFSARYSTIFSAALPSSSSLTWPLFGGGGDDDRTVVPEPSVADEAGLDPDVGERDGLLRLRLRAHDPLERRVARLVDRVRHGDDGGERRGDHVVPELRLALARELRLRRPSTRRPGRPSAGGAGRTRPPRARRRPRRWTAGRRGPGPPPPARARPRALCSWRAGPSRPRRRRRRAVLGRRPSRAPCAATPSPSRDRARRPRPRLRARPSTGAPPRRRSRPSR